MVGRLFAFYIFPLSAFCQNTIGMPEIANYSRQVYKAGLQTWDIRQDTDGLVYFANNEGMLSYDGHYWANHPLPNKTIVRSLEIAPDGRIYAGGQDELGYFFPASNGRLQFFSLTGQIPAGDRSFGDVWDIKFHNGSIFFRSSGRIFRFNNEKVDVFKAPSEWSFLGNCDDRLFAHDYKAGLLEFENGHWIPACRQNTLPVSDAVTGIVPSGADAAVITTLKNGLFLLSGKKINELRTASNSIFRNHRIYGATPVGKDLMALATNINGVYVTDFRGNIIQGFSRAEGLQNNNVLSIFCDREQNLWLGLDNGIDLVAFNSSIKQIRPLQQDGSGYAASLIGNRLYLGTSNGLFSTTLQDLRDYSFSQSHFKEVKNAKGQTWGLAEINHHLLLAHHEGAFEVRDDIAIPLNSEKGCWNFVPLSNASPVTSIISGTYNGIRIMNYTQGRFKNAGQLEGFSESSRFLAQDQDSNLWVSHPYHGVFKISTSTDGSHRFTKYSVKDGLPSDLNNHIYVIKKEVVVATEKGIYLYNQDKELFEPSPSYQKLLGNQSIRYLRRDGSGNIWFIHEKNIGVIDYSKNDPEIIRLPELDNRMLSGFEMIYPVNENNILVGGENGFYHINYAKYRQTRQQMKVRIRSLRIIDRTDSLVFGGYHILEDPKQQEGHLPSISHRWKTIRIEFSSPTFGHPSNLEYSHRLKGYENNWSEWTGRTEKEYTNLPAGTYVFEVKVRNNLGNESETDALTFRINPPWYRTNLATSLYFLVFIAAIYFIYKRMEMRFRMQRTRYKEEQEKMKYILDLELSKKAGELAALRNEKLEADISHKNSELASSAMHLVKKGELVSKMKTELSHVVKILNNPQAEAELKKIIKSISEDDNLDREWENFALHFDKVNGDFISALKEKHPSISGNEIKLCAYLRMNLTTKEIAQLMNISVRGVEVSRYRLRKKLELPTETSLFDYLIGIQVKQ